MPLKPELATQEEWDSAQRMADAVNIHLEAVGDGARGKYVAVRLADGRSDGALYDSRAQAAKAQTFDPWCFFVKVNPGGMQPREAWTVLSYARQAKKAGVIFSEEEAIVPQRLELGGSWLARHAQSAALLPGGTFSNGRR